MKQRLAILARRRQELMGKIAVQRMEVAEISRQWQKPLALVDKGIQGIRFIRNHPGVVSGGFAALMSLRGMGMAGLVQKGWRLLYLYPSILSFGFKHLFLATRSSSAEVRLAGHLEEREAEVDNQQIRKA